MKALEWVGVLNWQNRIVRVRERCQDLFGADGWRWRVVRTSNAYVLTTTGFQVRPTDRNTRSRGLKASTGTNR